MYDIIDILKASDALVDVREVHPVSNAILRVIANDFRIDAIKAIFFDTEGGGAVYGNIQKAADTLAILEAQYTVDSELEKASSAKVILHMFDLLTSPQLTAVS